MNKDLNLLLNSLEPEIDKKCMELKKRKKQKIQSIKLFILCLLFIIIPNIFILFNIKIIYLFVAILFFGLLKLFIKLPDILKNTLEVNYHEQIYREN